MRSEDRGFIAIDRTQSRLGRTMVSWFHVFVEWCTGYAYRSLFLTCLKSRLELKVAQSARRVYIAGMVVSGRATPSVFDHRLKRGDPDL